MKIFAAIDPGKNWGWARYSLEGLRHSGAMKFESLMGFEQDICNVINCAVAVATCRAMGRNQQVIRFHSAMAAIVEITCERKNIPYFDVADVTMRKSVIGKGNAKKPEVMAFLDIENEHAADAMVGARYLAQNVSV